MPSGLGGPGESMAMTGETPGSQEEEERHTALMAENEQLKRQIAEVSLTGRLLVGRLQR